MCKISCCVANVDLDEKIPFVDPGNLVFLFWMVACGWIGLFRFTLGSPPALFDLSLGAARRLAECLPTNVLSETN